MKDSFSGWREGLPHYLPFFVAGFIAVLGLRPFGYALLGAPLLALACCAMLFFRDFPRRIERDPSAVLAPADGTVAAIEHLEETPHYDGPTLRISIFMSVFNVHVNRAPCDGCVRDVRYAPGAYVNAMRPEASRVNESNALWLDTARGPVTVRQISGAVARRIVCRAQPGDKLNQGQKFGMIKFGSRVEVYLPPDAMATVKLGDKTRAGINTIAKFS